MNSIELNKRLKVLDKECENIKHERKLLATDYEALTELVKKCGILSIVCLVLHGTVLAQFMKSKSVTVIGLGRFLSPFVFIIFIGSFIVFMIKGFDWFLHADTKYSKKLAARLNKVTVTAELKKMNDTIMTLEAEIDRIENEIYEMGGTIEREASETEEVSEIGRILSMEQAEEAGEGEAAGDTDSEDLEMTDLLIKRSPVIEPVQAKTGSVAAKRTTENVDDILSALDAFDVDEDEDEFENSSELWKKDAMKRYSKY